MVVILKPFCSDFLVTLITGMIIVISWIYLSVRMVPANSGEIHVLLRSGQ